MPEKDQNGNWEGSPTGSQQKIITYSLTDSTGVTGQARYELTLHDEWEDAGTITDINPNLGPPIKIPMTYEPSNPGTEPKTLSFNVDTSKSESLKNDVKFEAGLESTAKLGASLPALKGKGVDFSAEIKATTSITEVRTLTEEEKQSISLTDGYRITLQPGETAHPIYYVRSHYQEVKLRQYDAAGFVGDATAKIMTYNDLQNNQNPVVFDWSPPGNLYDPQPTPTPSGQP